MNLLNYFLVFFLPFITVSNGEDPLDELRNQPGENEFRYKDRLFAQIKDLDSRYKTVFFYPKGRTIEAILSTEGNPDKTIIANVYFKKESCPNLSDLTGLKLRMEFHDPAKVPSFYETKFNGNEFTAKFACINRTRTNPSAVFSAATNVPKYEGKKAILEFGCADYVDNRFGKNHFKVKISAEHVKCDFFVYFEYAVMIIPPESRPTLSKENLPLGVSLFKGTQTQLYQMSLFNSTTISFASTETIPLFFNLNIQHCLSFATEIQINGGSSFLIKLEHQNIILSTRGKQIRSITTYSDIRYFMFGINENTISSVLYRAYNLPNTSEKFIDENLLHDFKAFDFGPFNTKNMTFTIRPRQTPVCRKANLVLGSSDAILLREPVIVPNITSSSASVEAASFPWWPIVVAIAVLLVLGIGILIYCLYRKGKICNKNKNAKKPEDDPQAIPVVVAKTPVARTPAATDNDDVFATNEENENEDDQKDSKKDDTKGSFKEGSAKETKKSGAKDLKKKKSAK